MKKIIFSTIFLLALACCACAQETAVEETGVVTNVQFMKLVKNGTVYDIEPLQTLYTGENKFGKYEFVVHMDALESGDYALAQISNNVTLIQALKIDVKKGGDVEYVEFFLTVRPQDLPEPLVIYGE